MEARVIIASATKSNKSENTVWAVAITGCKNPVAHCKSAYKAMRFAFLLKKRTGLNISENCLARLSQEIAGQKAAKAADVPQEDKPELHSEPQPEQPKRKRGRPRKTQQVVALQ